MFLRRAPTIQHGQDIEKDAINVQKKDTTNRQDIEKSVENVRKKEPCATNGHMTNLTKTWCQDKKSVTNVTEPVKNGQDIEKHVINVYNISNML